MVQPEAVEAVLVKALCQGLVFCMGKIGRLGRDSVLDRTSLGRRFKTQSAVDQAIKAAAKKLANLADLDSDVDADRIRDFLRGPETEALARQMFAVNIARGSEPSHDAESTDASRESLVRDEYLDAFGQAMGGRTNSVDEAGAYLIKAVAECAQDALRLLIKNRELGAHEALSGARFALIRGELEWIKRRLDGSVSATPPEEATREFEDRYRRSIQTVHRYIKPPHMLDEEQRVPIGDLYVPPTLLVPGARHERTGEPLTMALPRFMENAFRAVLLGTPGGGKSTFVQNLCMALTAEVDSPFYDGRKITPIRVVLREYGKDRQESGISIIEHIEKVANSRYQVKAPTGAVQDLMDAGRVVVFFDGLDELLLPQHRRDIRTDIEAFCALHPHVPVIATSRVVGYDQAPLDHEVFTTFRLGQFDRDEVLLYGRAWYGAMGTNDGSSPEARAERLIQETRDITDLAANPLMLALICNLSRAMRELPQSRPKIFEACTQMLFLKWDDQRGFAPVLPFEAHVEPTLEYLANWIYSDETEQRQAGVSEGALVEVATEYLVKDRFPTHAEAAAAAETFIAHCTGRAWVFSDTGSTDDELLYEFTHRTFLEYYAAEYVVSWSDGIDEVGDWLVPRVAEARSDEVTHLVMHILCSQREQARDRLITRLLKVREEGSEDVRHNTDRFIVRCLEFVVPSIAVTTNVVEAIVGYAVECSQSREMRAQGGEPLSALGSALRCSRENRPIVLAALRDALIAELACEIRGVYSPLELALGLDEVLRRTTMDSVVPKELIADVEAAGREAVAASRPQIEKQALQELLPAQLCLVEGWMTIDALVARVGLRSLFRAVPSMIFSGVFYESIVRMLDPEGGPKPGLASSGAPVGGPLAVGWAPLPDERTIGLLAAIAARARFAKTPWMYTHAPSSRLGSHLLTREDVRQEPEALFGAILLSLPDLEAEVGREGNRRTALLEALNSEGQFQETLRSMKVQERDELFLKRWSERAIDVIGS